MKDRNKIIKLHIKAFFGFKLTEEELIQCIISKELKPFNKTYFDVLDEKDWYQNYEVTPEQNEKWKKWGKKFIKKHAKNSLFRSLSDKKMRGIDFQWGLKIKGGFEAIKEYEKSKKNGKVYNKK